MWRVYDKTGQTVRCEIHKLEYNGTWMGECFVSATINSPTPINFAIGDYLEYRGERFEINYDPSALKKNSIRTSGESFMYDSVKFNSLSDELTRCDFLDYVKNDNNIHFTSLPKFSFYASSIQDLADRIQVNLDRIYTGEKKWTVEVHPEYVNTTDVNISVDNIKVWDAIALVNSKFKSNFVVRGRKITIGTAGIAVDNVFMYGKGKGLYEIQRTAESDQQIITRLRAYGSTRNLPNRYYNKLSGGGVGNYLPDNMAVMNLMLPRFPEDTLDPYLDSSNIGELGVREGTVFFDGSDESRPEICPSMEGMTAGDLKEAGVYVNAEGNLDEVVSAEQIFDNGQPDDEGEIDKGTFYIILKDIGFDINNYLTASNPTISMKSGACGGREFEIVKCEKSGNNYKLTCNRSEDGSLNLFFPYKDYNIQQGDKFVLLGIDMPDVYIKAASQRLLSAAREYLSKNDYVRYSYVPKVDDIYMARQHDEAVATGGTSIHDTIKEGDIFLFNDADLGIDGSITIDSLTIKEGESIIPQYEIVLREEKAVGTIQKIQNQIDSITGGQSGGGYTAQQIRSLIKTYGDLFFISKTKPDQTSFLLKLLGGIISPYLQSPDFVTGMMGAGMSIYAEEGGDSVAWFDKMYIRKKAVFQMLSIMKTELAGASFMFNASGARATITKVERIDAVPFYYSDGSAKYYSDGSRAYVQPSRYGAVYRCYFLTDDGEKAIENRFRVGNLVRSQTFNIKSGVYENVSNHYWWRLVTAVGKDWIELSETHCDEGSDIPAAGDVMVQLGDISDTDYQAAIALSAYGDGAPYQTYYQGIDSYSLSGKDVYTQGYDRQKKECYLKNFGRAYIGDRDERNFLSFSPSDGLKVRGKLLLESGEDVGLRLSSIEQDAKSIRLSVTSVSTDVAGVKSGLTRTGIDITSGKITVTADKFLLKSTSGSPLAVFTEKDGKPFLKTECIDVNSLKVKHLDSADGSISIAGGKIALNDDGSGKLANGHISWDSAGSMSFKTGDSGERIELSSYSNSIVFCGDDDIHYLSLEFFSSGDSRSSRINMNDKRGRVTTIGPGSINMVFYNDGGIVQDERGEYNITLGSFFQMYHKTKDRLVVITPSKMQFNDGGTIYKGYTGTATVMITSLKTNTLYFKNGICYKIG